MPEGYLHLTCEQRCQIYALLQSGHSQAHIARQIGVDPSTVSRELVRNTGARGYRFKQAHEKASQRRQEASDKPRKMTPDLVELIEEKLTQEQWSPDQISGRLAKDGVAFISHERIYQHVWKDKKDGGTLYLHLRHSGKKYNRRKGKNSGRGLIPNRVDIDQRPPIVAAKSRIGDWEADTIIGANHKGVVMSHVERTSKYTKLAKLPDKNADSVVQACARVLLPFADQIETITYDHWRPAEGAVRSGKRRFSRSLRPRTGGVDLGAVGAHEHRQNAVRPAHGFSALEHFRTDCCALWWRRSGADALLRRAIPSDGVRAIDLSREPARYRGLPVGSSPKTLSHGFSRTGPTIDAGGRERDARLAHLR